MSEPRRFLADPDVSPFERDLLESWSSEQPSAAARARALAIGGVTVAALVGGAGAAAAPKAASVGAAALAKWGVLGVLVAGMATATVAVLREAPVAPSAPPTATASLATGASGPSTPNPTAQSTTPMGPPAVSPADLPAAAPDPTAAHAKGHVAAASGVVGAPSLAEEIALFDRARAALDAGEADRALGLLDTYESRFRSGAFGQEAEVLRVQALLRRGDRARASSVGERFLAAHPSSPHAARIRAILTPGAPPSNL